MRSRRRHEFIGATAFETVLGLSFLAWTERGVFELRLPDPVDGLTRGDQGRLRVLPASLPPGSEGAEGSMPLPEGLPFVSLDCAPLWVAKLCRRVASHFQGKHDDFLDIRLDLPAEASSFDRDIWAAAREVPPGLTITYGELAEEAGHPGAARAAGSTLSRCPISLLIPAHRVISANRRPGGWTGGSGVSTKLLLLSMEGVVLPGFEPVDTWIHRRVPSDS